MHSKGLNQTQDGNLFQLGGALATYPPHRLRRSRLEDCERGCYRLLLRANSNSTRSNAATLGSKGYLVSTHSVHANSSSGSA